MSPLSELPACLETARLYLRPYRSGDAPMYLAVGVRNRARLARYEADNPLRTITDEFESHSQD